MGEALAVRKAVITASTSNIRALVVYRINMMTAKESRPEPFCILFDIYILVYRLM